MSGRAQAPTEWPRTARCACGTTVVIGKRQGNGHLVILDATPILPQGPCPYCRGLGRRTVEQYATMHHGKPFTGLGDLDGVMTKGSMTSCPECGGTGVRGERIRPRRHVVMSEAGVVRSVRAPRAGTWEGVYRRHRCALVQNDERPPSLAGASA